MKLVYMDGKKEPYTLSSIVAECTGLQHHTITKTIRKHQARFEQFGKVGFKIQAMESGQNTKDYILNEQQATLLVTFLKNTEQVANFKTNLVKAFFEMREELSKFRMQRALEKPKRKTLGYVTDLLEATLSQLTKRSYWTEQRHSITKYKRSRSV